MYLTCQGLPGPGCLFSESLWCRGVKTQPLFQSPKTKAKQSSASVLKETLIKERYSAASGVWVCVFMSISRYFAACIQRFQCVRSS